MTTKHPPLQRQIAVRLFLAALLSGALMTALGFWLYLDINQHAAKTRQTSAHEHYINVIADLERRWGREAFNLKTRIESQQFFDGAEHQRDKLISYLTAQGSSLEFPSLRIEDGKGELIASFEQVRRSIPKVKFLPGQESTWIYDPAQGSLFLVFRQLVWLGKENGYLLLYKTMDHALLNQHSYPATRLSLWWKGAPVSSSEGADGLALTANVLAKSANKDRVSRLRWSDNNADTPELIIETTSAPLLSLAQLAIPMVIGWGLIVLATWAILGVWFKKHLGRLASLESASQKFIAEGQLGSAITADLQNAKSEADDEVDALVTNIESLMRDAGKPVHSRFM